MVSNHTAGLPFQNFAQRLTCLSTPARFVLIAAVATFLVLVARLPLMPAQLYSFDSVNLAFALDDFDPTRNQPQPPGDPFFVGEARLFYYLLRTPERTFTVLKILISGLSLGVLFLLAERMFSKRAAFVAAALLFVNPAFWRAGLSSSLRLHLALVSVAVGYLCWRACCGEKPKYFYAASAAFGLGSGFRPELALFLFPLWLWTAWQVREMRVVLRGALIVGLCTLSWVVILVFSYGGVGGVIDQLRDYLVVQTQQRTPLLDAPFHSWRRMAGRAILWTGLGAIPWLWAIPFGWFRRNQLPEWKRCLVFLCIWFLPGFLFHLLVHIGAPGHALSTIPIVCLVGGFCITAAEESRGSHGIQQFKQRVLGLSITLLCSFSLVFSLLLLPWHKSLKVTFVVSSVLLVSSVIFLQPFRQIGEKNPLVYLVIIGNLLLFFGKFPLPNGPQLAHLRGFASIRDAFLGSVYETSYARVQWVSETTASALEQIARLRRTAPGPVRVVWLRDGEPVWRKISFYFPSQQLYVLDEAGDPASPGSIARLWAGKTKLKRFSGPSPIRIPIPNNARLIWLVGGGHFAEVARAVPLRAASPLYYTDLERGKPAFQIGSFEFVPE
ncbi:MAG: glycosyltransferase family 39 protein [Acidobacteria bacterium]|nr:glycosyltransferase family 39 protein [Acidobacteriota bacterium]